MATKEKLSALEPGDANEIVQDLREHIEAALDALAGHEVDGEQMRNILDQLGSPKDFGSEAEAFAPSPGDADFHPQEQEDLKAVAPPADVPSLDAQSLKSRLIVSRASLRWKALLCCSILLLIAG
ncbi:MAG: hypothetical protein HQL31_12860, partial [Planctomycetes bacterium]|nr:hypothetical protein [Planctomycetota bacterium]